MDGKGGKKGGRNGNRSVKRRGNLEVGAKFLHCMDPVMEGVIDCNGYGTLGW